MARWCFGLVFVYALLAACVPSLAFAQGPTDARAPDAARGDVADVEAIAGELARAEQSLSTDDCAGACRALRAMQRAAERLCALDPGARCADVRARVEGARLRVRAACPECEAATDGAPSPIKVTEAHAAREEVTTASAPPRERGRGGCGGCAAAGATTGGAEGALALVCAALVLARKKRSPRL